MSDSPPHEHSYYPCPACGKELDAASLGHEAYSHVFRHLEIGTSAGSMHEFEVFKTKVAASSSWGPLALLYLRIRDVSDEVSTLRDELRRRDERRLPARLLRAARGIRRRLRAIASAFQGRED